MTFSESGLLVVLCHGCSFSNLISWYKNEIAMASIFLHLIYDVNTSKWVSLMASSWYPDHIIYIIAWFSHKLQNTCQNTINSISFLVLITPTFWKWWQEIKWSQKYLLHIRHFISKSITVISWLVFRWYT